jgi:hypothetical protein
VTLNSNSFIAILILTTALVTEPAMATVATKSEVVKGHLPRVPRVKLLRSNPHRFTAIRLQGTDPYDAPDDDFLCASSARKPKVIKPVDDDEELSDYVTVRLAVARARAMQRYREIRA